ncbi:DUF1294 domain-containing protein [Clostridium ihumii]
MLYILFINIISFFIMLIDKRKAINKKWRVRESSLITFALLGGCIGMLLSMYLFRHKTKHPKFYIGVPLILIIHLILLFVFISN